MTTCGEDVFLNDRWCLYFHDPLDEKWDAASYKEIYSISTVQELVNLCSSFKTLWSRGMFFLMREHIGPMWEDENNKNGGCLSYKIMKPDVPDAWFQLAAQVLGETVMTANSRPENYDKVCGISISPKKNYCILRIWISSPDVQDMSNFTVQVPPYTTVMYKPHVQHREFVDA